MKRILIAFDGSPGAEAAMGDMVRAGFPEKCEAKVLSIAEVWLPPDLILNDPGFPGNITASQITGPQHALEAFARAGETATRGAEHLHTLFPAWTVNHAGLADSPAWGILAETRKWPADLIVIGSHGRSRLERFFLGSVSYKVAAEASCSVRVFKAHHRASDQSLRVLIGIDGSNDSEAALQEALSRRWPADTKFHLVTIIDQQIRTAAISDASASPGGQEDPVKDSFKALLERRVEQFRERRFEADFQLLEGDLKSELLRHADAWQADCIFLGARGLKHGGRLYLGTFASAIVTRAHCTVEIVRPSP